MTNNAENEIHSIYESVLYLWRSRLYFLKFPIVLCFLFKNITLLTNDFVMKIIHSILIGQKFLFQLKNNANNVLMILMLMEMFWNIMKSMRIIILKNSIQ